MRPRKLIHDIQRSIVGWLIDGEKSTSDRVLLEVLQRVKRLEGIAGAHGKCSDCDVFLLKERFLFHHTRRLCFDCFDYAIVDEPEGVNALYLARRLLNLGLQYRDPERFKHICECIDCGDPGDDDYVDLRAIMREESR